MSDAVRLYRVVLRHIRKQPSTMLLENQMTLAMMITGILRGRSGQLRKKLVKQEITPDWERSVRIFGLIWLFLGISLTVLIIYSVLYGYQ